MGDIKKPKFEPFKNVVYDIGIVGDGWHLTESKVVDVRWVAPAFKLIMNDPVTEKEIQEYIDCNERIGGFILLAQVIDVFDNDDGDHQEIVNYRDIRFADKKKIEEERGTWDSLISSKQKN